MGWAAGSQAVSPRRWQREMSVQGPTGPRAESVPASYWLVSPWRRSPEEATPTRGALGLGHVVLSLSLRLGAGLSLRIGPAAPLGCGSELQPPAWLCVPGSREEGTGRKEAGGRRREAAHTRLPVAPLRAAQRPLPPPLLLLLPRSPLLPPEDTRCPLVPPTRRRLGDFFLAPSFSCTLQVP